MGEGDIVGDYTPKDEWRYITPNSTFEYMYKKICEEHQMDKDGLPNGQGTWTSPDGQKYVGEFKDGEFHGQGTLTLSDGRKYVGGWKDDKQNGQGTMTFSDGDKYVGKWKNGEMNGQGTYTWSDGDKYVGESKDNEMWNGTKYDKDGKIIYKVVNGK